MLMPTAKVVVPLNWAGHLRKHVEIVLLQARLILFSLCPLNAYKRAFFASQARTLSFSLSTFYNFLFSKCDGWWLKKT